METTSDKLFRTTMMLFRVFIMLSVLFHSTIAATIASTTIATANKSSSAALAATSAQQRPTVATSIRPISDTTKAKSYKNATATTSPIKKTPKSNGIIDDDVMCPKEKQAQFQLFPYACNKHKECLSQGKDFRCCKLFGSKRCIEGLPKPIPEPKHQPIFGIIPRKCPEATLAETWWNVQTCDTDRDCWPRVCCPDGRKKYCKTSQPMFEEATLPVARGLAYPVDSISQYLQCTPPPPPVFDPHPKPCNSTLECFPNLCCQEAGKKHCRPPRRSLLSLLTGFTQQFNVGIIKEFTDNLVIR